MFFNGKVARGIERGRFFNRRGHCNRNPHLFAARARDSLASRFGTCLERLVTGGALETNHGSYSELADLTSIGELALG